MPEPTHSGAVVIDDCGYGHETLHLRLPWNDPLPWECEYDAHDWADLERPRALTPAERAAHGIPDPAPVATDELCETFYAAYRDALDRGLSGLDSAYAGLLAIGLHDAPTGDPQ